MIKYIKYRVVIVVVCPVCVCHVICFLIGAVGVVFLCLYHVICPCHVIGRRHVIARLFDDFCGSRCYVFLGPLLFNL